MCDLKQELRSSIFLFDGSKAKSIGNLTFPMLFLISAVINLMWLELIIQQFINCNQSIAVILQIF